MMRKRSFSLVELLIAVTLLALIGAAVSMSLARGISERKERGSFERIESALKLAAKLAKITHREVKVIVFDEEGKKAIQIDSDIAVSSFMKTAISRSHMLEGVQDIALEPRRLSDEHLEISYFPWGLDIPEASLEIRFNSGNRVTCVPKSYLPQDAEVTPREHIDLYPTEVLQDEKEEKFVHVD